jgi:23S rRNA pseudouridine1911/1915/1917 synthase
MAGASESDEVVTGVVPDEAAGERLDKVLAKVFTPHSRSQLQAWLKEGRITLANEIPSGRLSVAGGEVLCLEMPPLTQIEWVAEPLALSVVHQDEHIVVIDKPYGLVVHPGAGNQAGTLANAILHQFPAAATLPRAGIVHRLDKDTSGLLVVALTELARGELIRGLETHAIGREYLAVVNGRPISGGTVEAPIGRHPRNRLKMAVTSKGRPAVTHYRLSQRFRSHTLLKLQLQTGRTHQIRVHMAHLGFPLVGDPVYGGRFQLPPRSSPQLIAALQGFKRQALHAAVLELAHPATGKSLRWESVIPSDFVALIDALSIDAAIET